MIALVLSFAVFLGDLQLPMGVAVGLAQIVPVLVVTSSAYRKNIIIVAMLATILTALGGFLSPEGGTPWVVVLNRVLAMAVIAITAVISYRWKTTEARLRENEEQYRSLFENSGFGVVIQDHEGEILFVNDRCFRMFGFDSKDEYLTATQCPEEMIAPPDRVRVLEFLETPWRKGDVLNVCEYDALRKDGSVLPVEKFVREITWSGTRVLQHIFIDTSRRKEAESALTTSEAGLAGAQKIAHLGNWEWDIASGSINWSDEIYRIFGFEPQKFTATYDVFLQAVHPDDRDNLEEAVQAALAGKSLYSIDHRIIRSNGEERIVHEQAFIDLNEDGEPIRMNGTVQDITDRVRVENELRTLNRDLEQRVEQRTAELSNLEKQTREAFDSSPIPIFLWQKEGDDFAQVDGNAAALARTGISRDQFLKRRAHEAYTLWPEGVRCMHECLDLESTVRTAGERPNIVTGAKQWVESTFVFIPPDRVMNHVRDMTEQKKAEQRLEAAKKEAEQANAAKTRFLAAASHDIRQPMQAITTLNYLLKNKVAADHDLRPLVDQLETNTDVVANLLNELLDISRLDAGVVEPDVSDVAVADIFHNIEQEFGMQAQEKGLTFRVVATRATVRSDPTFLSRIIRNLVSNAFRHTDEGKILIGCRHLDAGLRIDICDTGKGISSEYLEEIFDEFYQVDNPARDRRLGMGLGLAIVRRLTQLLNFDVEVSSTVGEGSRFSVLIPQDLLVTPRDWPTLKPH